MEDMAGNGLGADEHLAVSALDSGNEGEEGVVLEGRGARLAGLRLPAPPHRRPGAQVSHGGEQILAGKAEEGLHDGGGRVHLQQLQPPGDAQGPGAGGLGGKAQRPGDLVELAAHEAGIELQEAGIVGLRQGQDAAQVPHGRHGEQHVALPGARHVHGAVHRVDVPARVQGFHLPEPEAAVAYQQEEEVQPGPQYLLLEGAGSFLPSLPCRCQRLQLGFFKIFLRSAFCHGPPSLAPAGRHRKRPFRFGRRSLCRGWR